MSIFDQMRQGGTGNRFQSDFNRPAFHAGFSLDSTGKDRPTAFSYQLEYALTLEVMQTFWANAAQLESAVTIAKRAAAAHLFSDIHRELAILDNAIMSGSAEQAIECVSRIRQAITP